VEDLSQHILDVVENSLRHKARLIEISLEEDVEQDRLTLQIRDDGNGLDPQARAWAADPFFTTRPCRPMGPAGSVLSRLRIAGGPGSRLRACTRRGKAWSSGPAPKGS
jgi:signal transduction histidine kinase